MSDLVHHEPLHRAPEVVAFEILVTLGQAYLSGVCLVLAVQTGQPGPTAIVLGVLSVTAAAGYGLWLFGGPGTLMTLVNVPLLLLSLFAVLVSLQPDPTGIAGTVVRSDALGLALQFIGIASAVLGIVGGVFLPGPRRRRWHDAHRPDMAVELAPVFSVAALAERIGASLQHLRASRRARMAGRAPGSQPAANAIPKHRDIHGHEPRYELIDVGDWDPEQGTDAGDAHDYPEAEAESDPYRPPRP